MLTLLTPTRNRHASFALVERWIERQTYFRKASNDWKWVVVTDGTPPPLTMGQELVRRAPKRGERREGSLALNLQAALPYLEGDVVMVEDDDWYHPTFLEAAAYYLAEVDLVGYTPNYHYNLRYKKYRVWSPGAHCNLGSTAVSGRAIGHLIKTIQLKAAKQEFTVDLSLWKYPGPVKRLHNHSPSTEGPVHVGLKGLPGEPGYGVGHKDVGQSDPKGDMLRLWLGSEAEAFLESRSSNPVGGD